MTEPEDEERPRVRLTREDLGSWLSGPGAVIGTDQDWRGQRLGLPEALERECTGGMIGPAAGADFAGFCEIYASLPDVNAIIADPDHGVIPSDPMTTHALMGALTSAGASSSTRTTKLPWPMRLLLSSTRVPKVRSKTSSPLPACFSGAASVKL